MAEQARYDWHKIGVQQVRYVNFGEVTCIGLAGTIKQELEGRLSIHTAGIPEWVAALTAANPLCVIDHALGQFDIGPDQQFAEQLAREHQLVLPAALVRRCRVCGCTDEDCRQCIEQTGEACHWVGEDLCSACEQEGGQANG